MSVELRAAFESGEALESGRRAVVDAGGRIERAHSPVPPHEADASPVRRWVLAGGLTGFASGWALTIGTALAWPLRVGGKPIISWPAFFVIAFELTILFAALAGLAGFLRAARLPRGAAPDYQAATGVDRFDVLVSCDARQVESIREALVGCGGEVLEAAP